MGLIKEDFQYVDQVLENVRGKLRLSADGLTRAAMLMPPPQYLRTGVASIDRSVEPGIPAGRLIEITGDAMVGKTTLGLHLCASAQRAGQLAVFVDADHSLDPRYAKAIGVNLESLLLVRSRCMEDGFNAVRELMLRLDVGIVVIDSVPALLPRLEKENEIGREHVGLHGTLVSSAVRVLQSVAAKRHSVVAFVTHVRLSPEPNKKDQVERIAGGWAIRSHTSLRLHLRTCRVLRDAAGVACGLRVQVDIRKARFACAATSPTATVIFGKGFVADNPGMYME